MDGYDNWVVDEWVTTTAKMVKGRRMDSFDMREGWEGRSLAKVQAARRVKGPTYG